MNINNLTQCFIYLAVLLACVKPLGLYMANVYEGTPMGIDKILGPVERLIYKLSGVKKDEMSWI